MLTLTRPTHEPELVPAPEALAGLSRLLPPDIEVALIAIGEREDIATAEERARLRRVRAALEDELTRHLDR